MLNKPDQSVLAMSTAAGSSSKDDSFNKKDSSFDSVSLFSKQSESEYSGNEESYSDNMSDDSGPLFNTKYQKQRARAPAKRPASTRKQFLEQDYIPHERMSL